MVNRAEPWVQNYHLGELCPQDIKDAKVPSAPSGAIEAREFFRQRIKRTGAREKTLFPNEASNYQLGGQFAAVAGFVLDRAREKRIGPRLAFGMVCPNAAAVMRKDCGSDESIKIGGEHDAAAGFGTGPGSIVESVVSDPTCPTA